MPTNSSFRQYIKMKIGTCDLGNMPLFLAPMEDVTDPSFRIICKEYGANMVYTEFVNSDGLVHGAQSTLQKLAIREEERPVGIQIYGQNIDSMVEGAKMIQEANPDVLDINFGCPVKKIAGRGAGAGMLRDIPKLLAMTRAIVNSSKVPVTVKTRLGWDDDSIVIETLAEQLQDVGVAALTIHGRTRAQLYTGKANWELIGRVKSNPRLRIPIIGNGDISDGPSAARAFGEYGVDGVMIGRASFGRPWVFNDIRHYLDTGTPAPPMDVQSRVALAHRHLALSLTMKGDRRGLLEMRRHLSCYFKGLPYFKAMRLALVTENDPDRLNELIAEVGVKYAGWSSAANSEIETLRE